MKKSILILSLSASFVVGTLVTGNFVFADPTDGQNNLLGMILNKLNGTVDDATFVWTEVNVQSYTCPNLDEIVTTFDAVRFIHSEGEATFGPQLFFSNIGNTGLFNADIGTAEITTSNFILKGVLTRETFCGTTTTPSLLTVSGVCGLGETFTATSEEGLSVTFSGNIVCG